ncbi:MAG: hypothetical protein OCC49_13300 [Fibrobacterales bacterium]
MIESLNKFIAIRKRLENVTFTIGVVNGFILSLSEDDIENLKNLWDDCVREVFGDNNCAIVDPAELQLNDRVQIVLSPSSLPYYEKLTDFINGNKIQVNQPGFYIHELEYFEEEEGSNEKIKAYYSILKLIEFLCENSDHQKKSSGDVELFFFQHGQGLSLKIEYCEIDLINRIDRIGDIKKELSDRPDSAERRLIFINEMINVLNGRDATFQCLIKNWDILLYNYDKSFSLYLSGFSFDKIKTASTEYFHSLTDKLYETINSKANSIFLIPIAYIFLLTRMSFSEIDVVKDTGFFLLGAIFFIFIWFVFIKNLEEGFEAIEKDIEKFRDKISGDLNLEEIYEELSCQQNEILPKQLRKVAIIKMGTVWVFIVTLMVFVWKYDIYVWMCNVGLLLLKG